MERALVKILAAVRGRENHSILFYEKCLYLGVHKKEAPYGTFLIYDLQLDPIYFPC